MKLTLSVNGAAREVDVDPETPLLWVLRDTLRDTGPKYGCGIAQCGACTVDVDGFPTRSCVTPVDSVVGSEIRTISAVVGEGADAAASAVQAAWRAHDVPQCGYCQQGQMMNAIALLRETPKPTDEDIDAAMNGIACRCATYVRIRAAIHDAAARMEG